jgi:Protein of unknown function (DUF1203)
MRYVAISTEVARHYQSGGRDENGQVPERQLATGSGNPCRHCLGMIPEGAGMLVLAHRPFPALQPVRGYGADDRIVYGTGGVVATEAIAARAGELFADAQVAYLHVRSARNNCYQCRIDRV